jgi:hypothetical protein
LLFSVGVDDLADSGDDELRLLDLRMAAQILFVTMKPHCEWLTNTYGPGSPPAASGA